MLEGTFEAMIEGAMHTVKPASAVYIPANAEHFGRATSDADVVFFTCKDAVRAGRHKKLASCETYGG